MGGHGGRSDSQVWQPSNIQISPCIKTALILFTSTLVYRPYCPFDLEAGAALLLHKTVRRNNHRPSTIILIFKCSATALHREIHTKYHLSTNQSRTPKGGYFPMSLVKYSSGIY
jgi:hypothetical protein